MHWAKVTLFHIAAAQHATGFTQISLVKDHKQTGTTQKLPFILLLQVFGDNFNIKCLLKCLAWIQPAKYEDNITKDERWSYITDELLIKAAAQITD